MRKLLFVLAMLGAILIYAETNAASTRGYIKKNGTGTYVQPHKRTVPDNTKFNNYSAKGNVNPYTGKAGSVDPYKVNTLRRTR